MLYHNVFLLSVIPSHCANTDTTSSAPTLLFLKIVGGAAAIITVIYKILSIRYRFHCCSRADGPVQKWAGDLRNLSNAIPLCCCVSLKHTEMPVYTGWKTGWIKAAKIFHVTLFIDIKVCWRWRDVCLHISPLLFFLFVVYFCFKWGKKKDSTAQNEILFWIWGEKREM